MKRVFVVMMLVVFAVSMGYAQSAQEPTATPIPIAVPKPVAVPETTKVPPPETYEALLAERDALRKANTALSENVDILLIKYVELVASLKMTETNHLTVLKELLKIPSIVTTHNAIRQILVSTLQLKEDESR